MVAATASSTASPPSGIVSPRRAIATIAWPALDVRGSGTTMAGVSRVASVPSAKRLRKPSRSVSTALRASTATRVSANTHTASVRPLCAAPEASTQSPIEPSSPTVAKMQVSRPRASRVAARPSATRLPDGMPSSATAI